MEQAIEVDDFEINEEPSREPFIVDNDDKADWAMRKLASIRRKQNQNKAIFDKEVQRVTEWLQKVNTALEKDAEWFEANLKPYALQERAEGRKSVVLPHGTIKTIAGRPKIEITDEQALIDWGLASCGDIIRVKTEIDKKALNALITEDNQVISTQGEIVPAVRVLPAEPSISISIND